MTEKYLLFSLDDEQSKKLGEVISNPSAKKIANFLAENESSASEIASALQMPLNSVGYNIEKLLDAGIVEKVGGFLWSAKGKKIEKYKVANKLIVISPKKGNVYSKLKGILPVILISGVITAGLAWYFRVQSATGGKIAEVAEQKAFAAAPAAAGAMNIASQAVQAAWYSNPWVWFGLGGLVALIAFLIWNWKKL